MKTTGNWPVPLDPMEEEGGGGGVEVLMRWHGGGCCKPGVEIIPPVTAAPVCLDSNVARWAVNHSTKLSVRGL